MPPYADMVALGGGYLSSEYPLGHVWELTPEGHVMAFAYGWPGVALGSGAGPTVWTIEVRESNAVDALVIFRQAVQCTMVMSYDEEGGPTGYSIEIEVSTTRIGGQEIAPSTAVNYLYENGSEEYSYSVVEDDIYFGTALISWWSKPYFMEVPRGAVLVITEGDRDRTDDLRTFQKNEFLPALTVDRSGVALALSRAALNGYRWLIKKWNGSSWQTRNTSPASLYWLAGALWQTASGLLSYVMRTSDSATAGWHMSGSPNGGVSLHGSIWGYEDMWTSDYRFVMAAPTADGGIVSVAVRGRKFGEPASTPTSLWFTRSTGVHPTVAGAPAGWITPVQIAAEIDHFEPYAIWQKGDGTLMVSNGREGIYQSSDLGHTWTFLNI